MATDDPTPPVGFQASQPARAKSAGPRDVQKRIAACRNRLTSAAAILEGRNDEGALEDVAQDLRALLSDLEREHADEARPRGEVGVGVWLGGLPRRKRYVVAGTVVVVLAVVVAAVAVRGVVVSARAARYDEIFVKAGSLLSQGRNSEAAQAYRTALAILPNADKSADGYNNLGWALQQQGKLDEAIEAYASAVKLKPAWELAANNLAVARAAKAQGSAQSSSSGPR